jgi:cyclopropane-fatty-acyl-phospholipid synthase
MSSSAEVLVRRLLTEVRVEVNGPNDCDPQVHDERFYAAALGRGTLGAGEAYVAGWWDCERLDVLAARLLSLGDRIYRAASKRVLLGMYLRGRYLNRQSIRDARRNASRHYDLGNALYVAMLGPTMAYSCGYWSSRSGERASNLDQAQEAKYELCCRKLGLDRGMRLLDVGCGWGGLLAHAHGRYGICAYGVTPAENQVAFIRERLPELTVWPIDYRGLRSDQRYDRIASVGMFEHVGRRNYRTFFGKMRELLLDDGLLLLHTIGGGKKVREGSDPWIERYIFPGGQIPALHWITDASRGIFLVEDVHNFGSDYDPTLTAWYENFDRAWPQLRESFDDWYLGPAMEADRFYRMWRFYLLTCAGSFRARHNNLWQIVLSPNGVRGGYQSAR